MKDYYEPQDRLEWSDMCIKAMRISFTILWDRLDKSGMSLFWHSLRVANNLKKWVLQTAGLLHDIIEDGTNVPPSTLLFLGVSKETIEKEGNNMTLQKLYECGIRSEKVLSIVDTLTHKKGENYWEYIYRVKNCPNARLIKLVDINDNMSVERTSQLPMSTQMRMSAKYNLAVRIIREIDPEENLSMDRLINDTLLVKAMTDALKEEGK